MTVVLFFSSCRVQGGTFGLCRPVRAVSHGDYSPEDEPKPQTPPLPVTTVPLCQLLEDPCQSSVQIPVANTPANCRLTAHPTSRTADPPSNSKSLRGLYPEGSVSGRGRDVGRLGVSFCFSRRGPRLEPCASVFSDLEEEERDKREQMKERIKGIMEDIYREIEEAEGRKRSGGNKPESNGPNHDVPAPMEAPADNGENKKENKTSISTTVPDTITLESLPRLSQSQMTSNAIETVGEHADIKNHAPGLAGEDDQYVCVQSKDGTTCLQWPTSLIKFTKSWPQLCYSGNPRAHQLPQDSDALEQKLSVAVSGKSGPCAPTVVTPDTHTCLQRQGDDNETRACRLKEEVRQDFKRKQQMEVEMEEQMLLVENSHTLSSLDTTAKRMQSYPSRPDPDNCKSSPQSFPGDTTCFSNKELESVLDRNCLQRVFTSPCRCQCSGETVCQCGLQTSTGIFKLQTQKCSKASARRDNTRKKRKRGRREKTSSKQRKVRSVVSNVSTEGQTWSEGWTRRTETVRAAPSCSPLGRCEAQPLSVLVRKRRPHRSVNSSGSQSEADGEPARRRSFVSFFREKRDGDRDVPTFPWRSRLSLHSPSSGCNSKLSWERGHHSNPRSFIDCCYPDNSCACKKVVRGDRIFIQGSGRGNRSPRRGEVQGEAERRRGGSKTTGVSGGEDWKWEKGRWKSRDGGETPVWDRLAKLHCSPGRCRRAGQFGRDEADWDRWMLGSDSWEERVTDRSVSGSCRRGPGGKRIPDSVWKCSGSRGLRVKRVSSPEWWNSQHNSSPRSTILDPRSCSPCSSTSASELSWEWSRSSTSSEAERLTATSCSSLHTRGPGLLPDFPEDRVVKQDSLPHKSRGLSPIEAVQKHHDADPFPSNEVKSQSDPSTVTERLSPAKPGPQKSGRTLILPLIGKLPAIQWKARRKTGIRKEEVKGKAGHTLSQEHLLLTPNPYESKISADTLEEAAGPPSPPPPVSFTAEEMDKYRLLQEQAREHMQKVLEQTQETTEASYTRPALAPLQDKEKEEEEQGTFASPPTPQDRTVLPDVSLSLRLPMPLLLPQQDDFPQTVALSVPAIPNPQSDLHHIILQPAILPLAQPVTNTPPLSSPLGLPPPPPPHLPNLHLSPLSISSLFPSILLSHHHHHPVALLPPTPTQLTALAPVTLQPLGPGSPFVSMPWPMRFQQKAL